MSSRPVAPRRPAEADAKRSIPPELSSTSRGRSSGRRKPIRKVHQGLRRRREGEHLRLLINAQVPRNDEALREAAAADPRIELMLEDEPEAAHRARFAACDVCLAPSRWEGLGLPLYEATAFGMPIITNDKPPMSEMVIDGRSGILVAVGAERDRALRHPRLGPRRRRARGGDRAARRPRRARADAGRRRRAGRASGTGRAPSPTSPPSSGADGSAAGGYPPGSR